MKAIGFKTSLPINEENSFFEFETEIPKPDKQDLLVKIKAIAVNPVDYKIRQNSAINTVLETPKIIGWDAAGIVVAVGDEVDLFKVGDEVFYAGDITKPGCNAEYQTIDQRIVGKKPVSLNFTEAAALPLTSLTAWEILFDRLRISKDLDQNKNLLIIGGAGGVGSIAIQLAKKIAGLNVIATASRPESAEWCTNLGTDIIVNPRDLVNNMRTLGYQNVDYILDFVDANNYWDAMVELIKPQGHIASITGSNIPIALNKLKTKSASFSWEFMYTRSMFQTNDLIKQHHILNNVANLIDLKTVKGTLNTVLNGFTVNNLKRAHAMLESGETIGKIVINFN